MKKNKPKTDLDEDKPIRRDRHLKRMKELEEEIKWYTKQKNQVEAKELKLTREPHLNVNRPRSVNNER